MTNIQKLIHQLAAQEAQLQSTQFLAPCVPGGQIRTRIAGMVYTFIPQPRKFEGWGIFQPIDEKNARLIEAADLPQVADYLQQFRSIRFRLAHVLDHQTWLAYPANEIDMRQRIGKVQPVPVHLVTEGTIFDQVVARSNGPTYWFEDLDRRADPMVAETLRSQLQQLTPVKSLHFKGITPEMRTVYHLATQSIAAFSQHHRDERQLRQALKLGGGELRQFQDRGDYWTVEWITANGEQHTSAIAKSDLTVMSSGICLSGRDRDFDLQSLVGVMEDR